jgi:molybdopterin-guanine dinucleotide biosynthesis protein A
MPPGGVTAVVLAGGDPGDALAVAAGVPAKALLPVAGRPLAAYVLDALAGSGRVDEVVYVGPGELELAGYDLVRLPSGRRFEDSFALGLGAALCRGATEVLLATADLPWLVPDAVARFVDGARSTGAQVVYPVVSEADMARAFPEQRRTYVRLRDGRFTGGNLALLAAEAVPAVLPLIARAFGGRKDPLRLAALVGLGVLLRLVTGTATLAALEARVGRLLGVSARALPTEDASVAADVDRLDHLPGVLDPAQPEWRNA